MVSDNDLPELAEVAFMCGWGSRPKVAASGSLFFAGAKAATIAREEVLISSGR